MKNAILDQKMVNMMTVIKKPFIEDIKRDENRNSFPLYLFRTSTLLISLYSRVRGRK